ncbi:hypothetical protein ABBQ38_014255 [Trebouxia sp. C0009 RCD-2024]
MYRSLTSLSFRVCRHNRGTLTSQRLPPKLRRASLPPHQPRSSSWHCHTRWYNSQVLAALASSTESLPGMAAKMLLGRGDAYEGFIVSADDLPTSPEEFHSQLEHSLQDWTTSGKKGIWITVPAAKSQLIPIAVKHGFDFHHAERSHVMLTRWLPTSENTLPPNASHQVGIGAFVMNSKGEVLVVQERFGPLKGSGVWKMPTGLVLAGEDITEAAEREVLEETGLEATFEAILAIRQSHKAAFGKSDMFFAVALKPVDDTQPLVAQATEVDGVKWMPLEDFASNPFSATKPLYNKLIQQCVAYANGTYKGMKASVMNSGRGDRVELLMHGSESPKL